MPYFQQLVSMFREQMNATVSRSDVLKPLAWLVGIVASALVGALYLKPQEWVIYWLLIALISSIGLYAAAFIFCLFFDRDALRSEKYSLHKMAIEHGLIGDSTSGLFDPKTIPGEALNDAKTAVDVPKIEKQE